MPILRAVVIWVNGPFGVGKTTTVNEIMRRVVGSYRFDPEHIGSVLRLTLPDVADIDFQRLQPWREGVVAMIESLHRHRPEPMLVPMTVWSADVHDGVIEELRRRRVDLRHITLMASEAELRRRIAADTVESEGCRTWRTERADACLAELVSPRYATHVDTDGRRIDEVVGTVLASVGL
jgi:hypothetical protein